MDRPKFSPQWALSIGIFSGSIQFLQKRLPISSPDLLEMHTERRQVPYPSKCRHLLIPLVFTITITSCCSWDWREKSGVLTALPWTSSRHFWLIPVALLWQIGLMDLILHLPWTHAFAMWLCSCSLRVRIFSQLSKSGLALWLALDNRMGVTVCWFWMLSLRGLEFSLMLLCPCPHHEKDVTMLAHRPQEEEVGLGSIAVPLWSRPKPALRKAPANPQMHLWFSSSSDMPTTICHWGHVIVTHFYCEDSKQCTAFLQYLRFSGGLRWVEISIFSSVIHLLFKHLPLTIHLNSMFQILLTSLSFSPSQSLFSSQFLLSSLLYCHFRLLFQCWGN